MAFVGFRQRYKISKVGIYFGLLLSIPLLALAALEAVVAWKVMENENLAFIQQSIGDTTQALAAYFRLGLGNAASRTQELAHTLQGLPAPVAPIHTFSLAMDPVFLDLSVWAKPTALGVGDGKIAQSLTQWRSAQNAQVQPEDAALMKLIQDAHPAEVPFLDDALGGQTVWVSAPGELGKKGILLLAMPTRSDAVPAGIVVSHLRVSSLGTILKSDSIVSTVLVDTQTQVVVQSAQQTGGADGTGSNLWSVFLRTMKNVPNGQLEFSSSVGQMYLGGYSRLEIGNLAVLATVPKKEATVSLRVMQKQLCIYLGVCFLLLTTGGYILATRSEISDFLAREGVVKGMTEIKEMTRTGIVVEMKPKTIAAYILHGFMLQEKQWLNASAEDSAEAMHAFFSLVSNAIVTLGGTFKLESGTSLIGVWGITGADLSHFPYLLAALQIRSDLRVLNEARILNGKKPLYCSMGIHTGPALVGRFGGSSVKDLSVVGEVLATAKMLARLTLASKSDLLVSSEVFQPLQTILLGDRRGEIRYETHAEMTPYYSLSGYRDGDQEVRFVEPSFPDAEGLSREVLLGDGLSVQVTVAASGPAAPPVPTRWLINNGSQILGPLTPREIAGRLFVQELDFDCECWAEGTGTSAEIRNAGIFSGSASSSTGGAVGSAPGDPQAQLWAYDGELIHGPLSLGFLKTALHHGALPKTISLCESSTVQGWKTLTEFTKARSDLDLAGRLPEHPEDPAKKVA